jgi:hypothetical protein
VVGIHTTRTNAHWTNTYLAYLLDRETRYPFRKSLHARFVTRSVPKILIRPCSRLILAPYCVMAAYEKSASVTCVAARERRCPRPNSKRKLVDNAIYGGWSNEGVARACALGVGRDG